MGYPVLTADRVKAGEALPELSIEVQPIDIVLGALASRDWRPQHHDYKYATERNGVRDIFMNTPNLAAWFERYVTDWTGPFGRMGWIRFRMKDSVFPGETMVFRGTVTGVDRDARGCAWAELELELTSGGRLTTVCTARVAIPAAESDNPWKRRGEDWKPRAAA
jgi:acyl dehydratase